MTGSGEEQRARDLHDEGARLLASLWDDAVAMTRVAEHPSHHGARGTLAYAGTLLREGTAASVDRAERAIEAVLALQETRRDDAHCGNFRWTLEEETVSDLNGVEFAVEELISLLHAFEPRLGAAVVAGVRDAIALGLEEIERLDVHPSYTNIALTDICNSILGGELLAGVIADDGESFGERYVASGVRRLDEWFAFTSRSGAPHEFNSPTYLAVDIERMASLAAHTTDAEIALKARIAEEVLWLHVATHYHAALAQIAGPHSRSYFDGWTGAGGYLKLLLWRILGDDALRRPTPYARRSREEAQSAIAADTLHCPAYVIDWMREKRMPFEVHETTDVERGVDITTYLTANYALGTASRSYTVGAQPEQWPAFNSTLLFFGRDGQPGYGTLFARYLSADRDRADTPRAEDLWDEGTFVGAQHRNRAIVAYGLTARMRAVSSYKLSVRMLGISPDTIVYAGERRVETTPIAIEPGEPIVIAEGGVYVAILPLEPTDMGSGAPIELRIDGQSLVLDIYNYLGPAKQFWEYRSLAGPFFKGNVQNAFVLDVGDRADFADVDAFRRHVAAAHVSDVTSDDGVREIAYATGGGSIALRYSLGTMAPLARTYDGVAYAPPMARAGALDGRGMQSTVSRDTMVGLGGARLIADQSAKWLVADDDAQRYVFVHPHDETTPIWLETPCGIVECDAFGFGRIEIDGAAQVISVEANGAIGGIRISGADGARLTVNGIDVTAAMAVAGEGRREFHGVG